MTWRVLACVSLLYIRMFRARGSGNHFFDLLLVPRLLLEGPDQVTCRAPLPGLARYLSRSGPTGVRQTTSQFRGKGHRGSTTRPGVIPRAWNKRSLTVLGKQTKTNMMCSMPLEAPWESSQDLFRRSRATKSIGTFWQLGFKRMDIQWKTQPLALLQTAWTFSSPVLYVPHLLK